MPKVAQFDVPRGGSVYVPANRLALEGEDLKFAFGIATLNF
jgi:hypothetical protein